MHTELFYTYDQIINDNNIKVKPYQYCPICHTPIILKANLNYNISYSFNCKCSSFKYHYYNTLTEAIEKWNSAYIKYFIENFHKKYTFKILGLGFLLTIFAITQQSVLWIIFFSLILGYYSIWNTKICNKFLCKQLMNPITYKQSDNSYDIQNEINILFKMLNTYYDDSSKNYINYDLKNIKYDIDFIYCKIVSYYIDKHIINKHFLFIQREYSELLNIINKQDLLENNIQMSLIKLRLIKSAFDIIYNEIKLQINDEINNKLKI